MDSVDAGAGSGGDRGLEGERSVGCRVCGDARLFVSTSVLVGISTVGVDGDSSSLRGCAAGRQGSEPSVGRSAAWREGHDASSGHLYVFLNRRGTQTKILFFDRTGYVIFHKRLEAGKFRLSQAVDEGVAVIEVDSRELGLMLEGVEVRESIQRRRWRKNIVA